MVFSLKQERWPIDTGWGVLYLYFLERQSRQGMDRQVTDDQANLIELMQRISQGDDNALAKLYDLTVNRVYGMALKIVMRKDLAEEVVSDVYIQVWRKAHSFKPERASPIGWLLMICRSRALDRLRREKSATKNQYQEDDAIETEDETTQVPLDKMMEQETSTQVAAALKLLNKNQRESIALAFYRGMSHQEISDYTGQPLGTVKSNIRRAQDILRNMLNKDALATGGFYGKA